MATVTPQFQPDPIIAAVRSWLIQQIKDAKVAARGRWRASDPDCLPDLATVPFLEMTDGSPEKYAALCSAALAWLAHIDPEQIATELRVELVGRHWWAREQERNAAHKAMARRALHTIDYRDRLQTFTKRLHQSRENDYPGGGQ